MHLVASVCPSVCVFVLSCEGNNALGSVRLSVRPSVRPFVCLCSHGSLLNMQVTLMAE